MCAAISVDSVSRPELAKHDSSVLDLAFVMDCTGSMGSYIHQAQDNIRKIVEDIVAKEKSDLQLALIEYRDHPPQDTSFVTRPHDFTGSVSQMKIWLDDCHASGGGDGPEAVADGLYQLLKLSWREKSTKICVFIADAPPHGLSQSGDGFPKGCPDGIDPMDITQQLAGKGITIYTVGCEPSINPYKDFFMAVAYITGGQYVPLRGAKNLAKIIIGGAQEEITLDQWMVDVQEEVNAEIEAHGGADFDDAHEEMVSRRVHEKLQSKGARAQQLQMNSAALVAPSVSAQMLSKFKNMDDVRANFKMAAAPPSAERTRRMMASSDSRELSMMDMCEDVYSTEHREIDHEQARRMVKKSLAKSKASD